MRKCNLCGEDMLPSQMRRGHPAEARFERHWEVPFDAGVWTHRRPTSFGDNVAADMRAYYDANRPLTFMEKLFGKRITATCYADNLMIGLMNIAVSAYRPSAQPLEPKD